MRLGDAGVTQLKQTIGIYEHPGADSLLALVGNKLSSQLDDGFSYEYYILDTHIPNAFALPGGKVFVTRGLLLLCQNIDELAGVVGHEIIHSHKRHAFKQKWSGVLSGIIALPGAIIGGIFHGETGEAAALPFFAGADLITGQHSQNHEFEADKLGAQLSMQAGYNPLALAAFIDRLSVFSSEILGEEEEKNYFSSHPYTPDRIKRIQKNLKISGVELDNEAYYRVIEGMIYGENPAKGYETDGWFYHPITELKIELSDAFEIDVLAQSVLFSRKSSNEFLSFAWADSGLTPQELSDSVSQMLEQYTHSKPSQLSTFSWYGLQARQTVFENFSGRASPYRLEHVVVEKSPNSALSIFAFYRKNNGNLTQTLSTLQPVERSEMPPVDVLNMHVVQTNKGDKLNRWIVGEDEEVKKINRIINDLKEGGELPEGKWLKIISTKKFEP